MKILVMRINFLLFLLILSITVIQPCFSSGTSETNTTVDGTVISARGALGRREAAPSGPLYTGNGGENIRLAVLAPQVQGEVPAYLPIYIQGLLNNNFNKYSAVNLIDRQNLETIIAEQKIAASGNYSDNDFVKIGNLTNAQYFLFGTIQKLSGDRYSLQLSITDSTTGIRKANFMQDGSLTQLEGRGTLINEATAELLAQLGVTLTETGLQTLLAGNTSVVKAEAGLARGITAQAGGSEVEALFNFTQAITFDPSQIEALSRLNTLSSTISGGTISQRILNDLQARDIWLETFKETARFFNEHPPFEIVFDPNLIQVGQTDYVKRTANIGMRIALDSSEAGFGALNALLEGLEKTKRREIWGFSGWPLMDVIPRTAGTVVFGGKRSFSYKVDVALINEADKTIGNSSITLNTDTIDFFAGNIIITPPSIVGGVVNFRNVKAEDLTPTLTIVIVAVNGISSRELNASGYMKIETGDLEKREKELETVEQRRQREREVAERQARVQKEQEKREREVAERQAQAEKEREKQYEQAQREREKQYTQAKVSAWLNEWGKNFPTFFILGYNFVPEMPLGGTLGYFGFYTSFNAGNFDFGGFEWTAGVSIPTVRWLRIPIGIGYTKIWVEENEGLFDISAPYRRTFVFETGLQLSIINAIYISSTYRFRFGDYNRNDFTFGVGFGGNI
jgi:hypothetical protein